jgi:hypothetical protein
MTAAHNPELIRDGRHAIEAWEQIVRLAAVRV